ncbi:hypothetical protein B0T14DRAFT_503121 [Immersiella caudata]|uniref:Uncharacterized protein n=1 Tax=Immersiella caudata TaxID=314043 RepID=A0AA39XDP4_9PEZI|nr:hypothetical protein B0T14DRAFT_503121 [Immersiella caudata]
MHRFAVFKDWFTARYYLSEDGEGDKHSRPLMALHIDSVEPRHRDEHPGNDNPEVPGLWAIRVQTGKTAFQIPMCLSMFY